MRIVIALLQAPKDGGAGLRLMADIRQAGDSMLRGAGSSVTSRPCAWLGLTI